MKRIILFVLIFCLAAGYVFARRGVDPSFIPIDDEPYYSGGTSGPSGREWKDPYLGMEFVWVKGGCYEMGDTFGDGDSDERPVHTVCVDGFWMGKYEVTFEEYDRFCEETGRRKPDDRGWGRGRRPVINVSWNDARAFAKWLSRKTGCTFRLPTEAEWEYACRSGGKKVKYATSTGDLSHDLANYYSRGGKDRWEYTSPVGSFPSNPLGLYDMSGNVWEWCEDVYDESYYSRSPRNNPQGPSSGGYRVLRGGSWYDLARNMRCANRYWDWPDYHNYSDGFRLVRLRSAQ